MQTCSLSGRGGPSSLRVAISQTHAESGLDKMQPESCIFSLLIKRTQSLMVHVDCVSPHNLRVLQCVQEQIKTPYRWRRRKTGNVKWCSHDQKQYEDSSKKSKNGIAVSSSNSTFGYMSKTVESKIVNRYLYTDAYHSNYSQQTRDGNNPGIQRWLTRHLHPFKLALQTRQTGWYEQQKCIAHSSGGWKAEIRVPIRLGGALVGLRVSLHPHMLEGGEDLPGASL